MDLRSLLSGLHETIALTEGSQAALQRRHPSLQLRRLLVQKRQTLRQLLLPLPEGVSQVFLAHLLQDLLALGRIRPQQGDFQHPVIAAAHFWRGDADSTQLAWRQPQTLLNRREEEWAGEHLNQGARIQRGLSLERHAGNGTTIRPAGSVIRVDRITNQQLESPLKNRAIGPFPGRVQSACHNGDSKHSDGQSPPSLQGLEQIADLDFRLIGSRGLPRLKLDGSEMAFGWGAVAGQVNSMVMWIGRCGSGNEDGILDR